jgi:UDP-2-acetamido-2,6-beta-L-arabino-hexul-4-ose reductase
MTLVYIDDVVEELIGALTNKATRDGDFCIVPTIHQLKLGQIVDLLNSFREQRENLTVPNVTPNTFEKKLYATYLSYLPVAKFSYPLKMNIDPRGSFTEIIRTPERGQFSVNISKPGITKGQHWHHTKNEKFVVVSGKGLIQLRKVGKDENGNDYPVNEFYVSGEKMEVVEMIPGYTHNIINLSETEDMVTFMWANESFDPNRPDTFFEEV